MPEFRDPVREEYDDMLLALACSLAKDADPNSNWVEKAGGLPDYICRVAKHIHANGHSISTSIAMAISQIKKWIATGEPDTKAKASAAIAQWEKMKASTKLTAVQMSDDMDLMMLANGQTEVPTWDDAKLQAIANNPTAAKLYGCGCGSRVPQGVIELSVWKEADHPRDTEGQFARKGAGGAKKAAQAVGSRFGSKTEAIQLFGRKNRQQQQDLGSAWGPGQRSLIAEQEQVIKEQRASGELSGFDQAEAEGRSIEYDLWIGALQSELGKTEEYPWAGRQLYPADVPPLPTKEYSWRIGTDRFGEPIMDPKIAKKAVAQIRKKLKITDYPGQREGKPRPRGLTAGRQGVIELAGKTEEGGAKKPYGNVTYADPGYQSDGVKRYPIDSEEHCRAAWSYINMPKNAAKYSPENLAKVKAKIKRALSKYTKEAPMAATKAESFLEAMEKIELHGIRGEAGYAFMHSPSPQVHSAANRLYETGRRRGLGVAEAQAVVERLENTDAYRRHIAAGGNRLLRTQDGETVPIGRGSHNDAKSGGGVNKPISVPVLDMLEAADDLTGNQTKARDRALKALRDGDDQKAAEILDKAIEAEPNKTLSEAIEKLGFESVPDGMDNDNPEDDEADAEPRATYDRAEGSMLDKQSEEFEEKKPAEPTQASEKTRPVEKEPTSSAKKAPATPTKVDTGPKDPGAAAASESPGEAASGAIAASFLRSFDDNTIELAVRRVRDSAYWKRPKGTPIVARPGGGGASPKG